MRRTHAGALGIAASGMAHHAPPAPSNPNAPSEAEQERRRALHKAHVLTMKLPALDGEERAKVVRERDAAVKTAIGFESGAYANRHMCRAHEAIMRRIERRTRRLRERTVHAVNAHIRGMRARGFLFAGERDGKLLFVSPRVTDVREAP